MATDSSALIDFPLFKLVNESRSTYGLRHQDFGRYQSHCAAKVHRLRKSAGLSQVAGKTKKYTKKEVTADNATTDKHLQILLFDAERAWAHSQLLKSSLNNPTTPASAKHHLSKRLSRAVLHSSHLTSLAAALSLRISKAQQGQAAAYHLLMKGSLAFEQAKHREGLDALSVAHSLLTKLAETAETAHAEALANEMIDEVEPMLRFCAYKLELDTSRGVCELAEETAAEQQDKLVEGYSQLVAGLEEQGKKSQREAVELSWRGAHIPVRSAELVGVVLKVKQALASLEADRNIGADKKKKSAKKDVMGARRMGTYDKALLVLSDAEEVARQLVEDNKIALSMSTSARFEASSTPLQLAHSYIVYQLLSVRTKRDLLLIEDTSSKLESREAKIREKEREYIIKTGSRDEDEAEKKVRKHRARVYPSLVKIYDGIVQSLEQMRDLEAVEQDGDLAAKVEARIAFVRAARSIYLSRTYALVEQFPSSLSLNARAKLYARQARSMASALEEEAEDDEDVGTSDPDFVGHLLPLTSADFNELDRELEADYLKTSKVWYAATGGKVGDLEPEDLPVEDLTLRPSAAGGASTSASKSKSKKPAFYDVAFNYVAGFDMEAIARKAGVRGDVVEEEEEAQEDSEDEPMPAATEEKPAPAKGGWGFGLFGRK